MQINFEGQTQEVFVQSFNDGQLKYQVHYFFSPVEHTSQRMTFVFPVKGGRIQIVEHPDKRANQILEIIAKQLKEDYPHDIKEVLPSSATFQ